MAFRLPEHLRERHEANRGVSVRRWSGNTRATPFPNFHTEPAYLVPWKKRSVTYPMGYQVPPASSSPISIVERRFYAQASGTGIFR